MRCAQTLPWSLGIPVVGELWQKINVYLFYVLHYSSREAVERGLQALNTN